MSLLKVRPFFAPPPPPKRGEGARRWRLTEGRNGLSVFTGLLPQQAQGLFDTDGPVFCRVSAGSRALRQVNALKPRMGRVRNLALIWADVTGRLGDTPHNLLKLGRLTMFFW